MLAPLLVNALCVEDKCLDQSIKMNEQIQAMSLLNSWLAGSQDPISFWNSQNSLVGKVKSSVIVTTYWLDQSHQSSPCQNLVRENLPNLSPTKLFCYTVLLYYCKFPVNN